MLFGWTRVLALLLFLAISADTLSASTWLVTLLLVQVCLMFSDVPADGYSVELGQLGEFLYMRDINNKEIAKKKIWK
jgi:hypothetical protein